MSFDASEATRYQRVKAVLEDDTGGDINSNNPLSVTIVGGGSSGTQYAQDTVNNNFTGNIMLWEDTGDTAKTISANTPLPVTVISGGGGGVQYTEGDTDASFTGTIALAEGDSDTAYSLQLDTNKNLKASKQSSKSVIDANNSSTTPLGISGAFTGTSTDVLDYSMVTLTVFADEDSATDGLSIEFSTDGTNWDDKYMWTVEANSSRRFQFPITSQYMRVVYVNGTTGQSVFRLQTILHPDSGLTSIHRIGDTITADRSAQLMKSTLTGLDVASGDFKNISSFDVGSFSVLPVIPVDQGGSAIDYTANGEQYSFVFSTDNTKSNARYATVDASGNVQVDIIESLPAGTNNIGDVDVVTIPEITQTTHDNLNANVNIQIGDSDVDNANPVPISDAGGSITVDGTIAATQSGTWNVTNISGTVSLPTGASTLSEQQTQTTHLSEIEGAVETMEGWDNAASDGASVSGDVAHDAVDAGEPVKTGGKASDYHPSAEGPMGPSEVATGDRANSSVNRQGQIIEGVNSKYYLGDGEVDGQYDATGTPTRTSTSLEVWNYRTCTMGFALISTGAPTDIKFEVYVSPDNSNWSKMTNGPLGLLIYDDTCCATELEEAFTFDICANYLKVVITATGGGGAVHFDVADFYLHFRN